MSYAKEIFDNIVKLEHGTKIAVQCQSKEHMNSLKTLINREKLKFMSVTSTEFDILITTKVVGDEHFIFLSKTRQLQAPFIINAKGEITGRLVLGRTVAPVLTTITSSPSVPALSQRERINQAMREDGLSEEEIAEYWNENPPEDMSIIDVPGDEKEEEKNA